MDKHRQEELAKDAQDALENLEHALRALTYVVAPNVSEERSSIGDHQAKHMLYTIGKLIDVWVNTHPNAL